MNEGILSQEEIDALTGAKNKKTSGKPDDKKNNSDESSEKRKCNLTPTEVDIIGEIGNISMSTAATTLSSLLNKKVLITTPKVSCMSFKDIIDEYKVPKVVANVEFKLGLTGQNLLMMDVNDAKIIADLMMGGDGTKVSDNFSEIELSAVGEAMNQMIGSASTAMSTMLGKSIDILPPDVDVWTTDENIDVNKFDLKQQIVKVAFDLSVEGLIESEIMQILTFDAAEDMIKAVMGEPKKEQEAIKEESVKVSSPKKKEVVREERPIEKESVEVKKPMFADLDPSTEKINKPRNLDLIMDVPLEFSVVLGKTKKSIKDILSFNNGSIVELNKLADEPLEIYVNDKLVAHGEVVVINENFGVRITNILTKEERIQTL